jgi:hypothetical protein
MNNRLNFSRLLLCGTVLLTLSCKAPKEKGDKNGDKISESSGQTANDHDLKYDFSKPTNKWELPEQLIEISGIVKLDSNHIIAIEDLHPVLYVIKLDNGKGTISDSVTFAETAKDKFDMEDLALTGNTVYALWSHGAVFKIEDWNKTKKVTEFQTSLDKKNNTEGLAFDPVSGNLLIACKDKSGMEDEKKSTRAVFEFDTKTNVMKEQPFMLIDKKDIEKMSSDSVKFYPSAISVHPISHDIYVLGSKGAKCIARFSHDGKLKSFNLLDPSVFLQPEGLCFDSNGNMYISSEGKHGVLPAIYEFNMQ